MELHLNEQKILIANMAIEQENTIKKGIFLTLKGSKPNFLAQILIQPDFVLHL